MSKVPVPVHLLPESIQSLVALLVSAGFELTHATTGNGRYPLGPIELTDAEQQEAFQRDLASAAQGFDGDVLDITAVRFAHRRTFEDCTISFTPSDLKLGEDAPSIPVSATLPAHMPAVSRAGAEAILAIGYRPAGHLLFIKGDHTRVPTGIKVQFSWC